MLAAQQKRKENIVEYILYLFQIEDIIRAFQFDILKIETGLISQYQVDEKVRQEIADWYKNLVVMMKKEGIQEKGHFRFLLNLTNELNEIHLKLMTVAADTEYVNEFESVSGLITELNLKGKGVENDLQIGLDAVYGFLLLKMQNKEITENTTEAIKKISGWLALLSKRFRDFEMGILEFE